MNAIRMNLKKDQYICHNYIYIYIYIYKYECVYVHINVLDILSAQ